MRGIFYLFVCCVFSLMADPKPELKPSKSELLVPSSELPYREFKNGQDAINWWNEIYGSRVFDQEEKKIIYDYTFGNFFMINDKLRMGIPVSKLAKEDQEKVAKLDEALSKTYIFENFIVYRYEKLGFFTRLIPSDTVFSKIYKDGKFLDGAEEYLNKLINKRYKDYGFMSTTMIRNSVFQDRVVELKIKAPRSSKAVFVSIKDLAAFDSQYELLFPRGKILSLESYEISSDRKNITINVKMQPPCLYSRSCDEIHVDNLRQPEFDLQPAKKVDDDNKIGSPYQRF